jgi:hypothetical protein
MALTRAATVNPRGASCPTCDCLQRETAMPETMRRKHGIGCEVTLRAASTFAQRGARNASRLSSIQGAKRFGHA